MEQNFQTIFSSQNFKVMKVSNVISVLAFFGVAIIVGNGVYTSRKRQQKEENLRFAIKHPLRAIDVLSAQSPVEDKVLTTILNAGHNTGHHLPGWAKRKLQKHIASFHSN
ncbi:MAG: hypothetical protein WCT03_16670 [Candidatus Obscuribacterales bacterium]